MTYFNWTDDRIETLKKMWATRMPARLIGERLGGVTKSMVLGKLHRLGLSALRKNAPPKVKQPKPPARRAFSVPAKLLPPTNAPKAIPAAPNSQPVDLMGLTNWTCHWPLWTDQEPARWYCGALEADVEGGRSYCWLHARAAKG